MLGSENRKGGWREIRCSLLTVTTLSITAALSLALQCGGGLDPHMLIGIAQHESGLDPLAMHVNADGSRDRGLMQVNERNDLWLGLKNPFDPCQSIAAAARLLTSFSRYNSGSPVRSLPYALKVNDRIDAVRGTGTPPSTPATEEGVDLDDRPAGIVSTELKGQ